MVTTRRQTGNVIATKPTENGSVSKRKFDALEGSDTTSNKKQKITTTPNDGQESSHLSAPSAEMACRVDHPTKERNGAAVVQKTEKKKRELLKTDFKQYDSTARDWSKLKLENSFDQKEARSAFTNVFAKRIPYIPEEELMERTCRGDLEVNADLEELHDSSQEPEQVDGSSDTQHHRISHPVRDLTDHPPASSTELWGEVDESADLRSDFGDDEFAGLAQDEDIFERYPDRGAYINVSNADSQQISAEGQAGPVVESSGARKTNKAQSI